MHTRLRTAGTGNPVVRPLATFVLLALAVYSLLAHWQQHGGEHPTLGSMGNIDIHVLPGYKARPSASAPEPSATVAPPAPEPSQPADKPERAVIAHFMLGNTYPFTESDWAHTLDLAAETGLDALSLNLGHEPWQFQQAEVAYRLANARIASPILGQRPVRLLFSLDMNVLPHESLREANILCARLAMMMHSDAQFTYGGHPVLTTFGGHAAKWGGRGWPGFLNILQHRLARRPSFWPGFFMNPEDLLKTDWIDGVLQWNNAWPAGNARLGLADDIKFLHSSKPYMAAVSPLFFTHYGTTGDWAFAKNFIYRSDDLLYPSRWALLMGHSVQPNIIHVTSWNDYGEAHNIAPVLGAEPGSWNWTKGMDHEAFRDMTRYFTSVWRDGAPAVDAEEITLWLWYRTHPASAMAEEDEVGQPHNSEWAQDLLNVVALVPYSLEGAVLEIQNGQGKDATDRTIRLMPGRMNSFKLPFVSGKVKVLFKSDAGTHISAWGREIMRAEEVKQYNFNMWSGVWKAKVAGQRVEVGV